MVFYLILIKRLCITLPTVAVCTNLLISILLLLSGKWPSNTSWFVSVANTLKSFLITQMYTEIYIVKSFKHLFRSACNPVSCYCANHFFFDRVLKSILSPSTRSSYFRSVRHPVLPRPAPIPRSSRPLRLTRALSRRERTSLNVIKRV